MAIRAVRSKEEIKALFPCTIQGETFKNQRALVGRFDVSRSTLQDRLKGGWPLEEAVGLIMHQRKGQREVEVNNVLYPSFAAAARAYGIDHKVARGRVKNPKCQWSDEEAVEAKFRFKYLRQIYGKKPIEHKGIKYANLSRAAKSLGLPSYLVLSRYHQGKTLDEVFSPLDGRYKSKKIWLKAIVSLGGKEYVNPFSAPKAEGLSMTILWHRVRSGWDAESAYSTPASEEELIEINKYKQQKRCF